MPSGDAEDPSEDDASSSSIAYRVRAFVVATLLTLCAPALTAAFQHALELGARGGQVEAGRPANRDRDLPIAVAFAASAAVLTASAVGEAEEQRERRLLHAHGCLLWQHRILQSSARRSGGAALRRAAELAAATMAYDTGLGSYEADLDLALDRNLDYGVPRIDAGADGGGKAEPEDGRDDDDGGMDESDQVDGTKTAAVGSVGSFRAWLTGWPEDSE